MVDWVSMTWLHLRTFDKGSLAHILQCDEENRSYKMHINDVRDYGLEL